MPTSQLIREKIASSLIGLGASVSLADIPLEHPAELERGDYASNAAMKYAKELDMAPKALAERIVEDIGSIDGVGKIEVAGPGFINFYLEQKALAQAVYDARSNPRWGAVTSEEGKTILVEYTDPNPFKAFHIGHLMSNAIGESLSRLYEFTGAKVIRANYQGDLGVHVACAIWGIKKLNISPERADDFGRAYAAGATAYKEDAAAKTEIDAINKKLYERSDPELNALYDAGRKGSLDAFERIYATLGTKFDRYYFESESGPVGREIVAAHPDIFPESDGARVFKGEEYGLHTRVFLNSGGLPTYEAKELGLEKMKQDEYPEAQYFVIVTANEVVDFFRVVKKAMELVYPDIARKLVHVAHAMMKLPEGKMSSRTGTVITGESLLDELKEKAHERAAESRADDREQLAQDVAVAAIKYQILRQSSGKDIIFDRERALSLEGDSGPYLQYAHARTHQIVEKAKLEGITPEENGVPVSDVSRLLHRFPEMVEYASTLKEPHIIATYLLELAGSFNAWYAQEQILDGTDAAAQKVALVDGVRNTLKNGLWLLGIPAPEKM